jgi:metal-responsive CopG/Arc/MetJ family transcriptional regulator
MTIKTAISLQEPLFEQAEEVARELNVSRSRLFAIAVEEFLRRHRNQKLLEAINEAYADGPDETEQQELEQIRQYQGWLLQQDESN